MVALTSDASFTKEQAVFDAVCQAARIYFVAEIYDGFQHVCLPWENLILWTRERIGYKMASAHTHEPATISEFLVMYSMVFSKLYLDNLRKRFDTFDSMVGMPVCEAFLRSQTFEAWTEALVESVFQSSYSRVQSTTTVRTFRPGAKRPKIPQFDRTDDPREDEIGPESRYDLHQIHLRGQTILDAWTSNDQVHRFGLSQDFPPGWTPQTPGGYDVFHGTSAHLTHDAFRDDISRSPFPGLSLISNPNQMVPSPTQCVFTAFSALRCFLWATFMADVIQDPPSRHNQASRRLQQEWETGGQTCRGVILLHFRNSQPTTGGLSTYIIPAGSENQWYQSVISCRGGLRSPDSLWTTSQFRNIHQESSNQWPDVIQGLEIQSSRTMLQPFIRNFWRTVWCSQAAKRELNSRHLRTYAISFELMPPVATNEASGSKGAGTLGRKLFGMGMKRFGDLFRHHY
ncbi:hypothetical protein V8E54_014808 [Elaphomyces granulatus]